MRNSNDCATLTFSKTSVLTDVSGSRQDVYGDWERRREVEDDGCVLLRPDRTICWRSMMMREDSAAALMRVLNAVLGRTK